MEYSSTVQLLLFGVWAIDSIIIAFFIRNRFYAYFGSVAFSTIPIGYSMVGYGLLEMGGILHALTAGACVLAFQYFFQRSRQKDAGQTNHDNA